MIEKILFVGGQEHGKWHVVTAGRYEHFIPEGPRPLQVTSGSDPLEIPVPRVLRYTVHTIAVFGRELKIAEYYDVEGPYRDRDDVIAEAVLQRDVFNESKRAVKRPF